MIPLVLGSIALAAVGYGVKEYCESEGCPWESSSYTDEEPSEAEECSALLSSLHETKLKLYRGGFVDYVQWVSQTSNLEERFSMVLLPTFGRKHHESLSADAKELIHQTISLLEQGGLMLRVYISKLENAGIPQKDYTQYNASQKKLALRTHKLIKALHRLSHSECIAGDGSVNEEYEERLKKLKKKLKDSTVPTHFMSTALLGLW